MKFNPILLTLVNAIPSVDTIIDSFSTLDFATTATEENSAPTDVVIVKRSEPAKAGEATFGYSGTNGPEQWGKLNAAWSTCSQGKKQSPIDFNAQTKGSFVSNNGTIKASWSPSINQHVIVETGLTLLVNATNPLNKVTYNGKDYFMKNIHFHAPSEHRFEGKQYPLELHMVHQAADKELLVVGSFVDVGATTNPFYQGFFDAKLKKDGGAEADIPLLTFDPLLTSLNSLKNIYTYSGSLTTPPCTEGVNWVFSQEQTTMTKEDMDNFKGYLPATSARTVQRSSSKVVYGRGTLILVSLIALMI